MSSYRLSDNYLEKDSYTEPESEPAEINYDALEPEWEELSEYQKYLESVRCHSLTLGGYMLKEIN